MSRLFREEVFRKREQRLDGEVRIARPPSFIWLAWLIGGIVLIAGVGLAIGDYARKETVMGVIEPEAGVLRVRAPIAGTVNAILVSEGDRVSAGTPLLRLAEQQFVPELGLLGESALHDLRERIDRIQSLLDGEQTRFRIQSNDLEVQHALTERQLLNMDERLALMRSRLAIQEQALKDAERLSRRGHEAARAVESRREALLSLQQDHQALTSSRLQLEERMKQIRQAIRLAPIHHERELDRLHERKEAATAELRRISHLQDAEIRSPVAGRVSGLTPHVGSQVTPDQTLIRILPRNSSLQVVLYVPTATAGTIAAGQAVRLRFDAFPYERFGIHDGEIIEVGATPLFPGEAEGLPELDQPAYRVIVAMDVQSIQGIERTLPLRPGMRVQADIITDRRSLFEWLFDPIYSVQKAL